MSRDIDWSLGGLSRRLEAQIRREQKRVGRAIGRKFVSKRKRRLGNASRRRKAGVRHVVGRDGELVLLDLAPMAYSQEFGAIIRPDQARELFIRAGEEPGPGERPFRRGDYLFAQGRDGRPRLLGVYKRQVRVDRVAPGRRFFKQADPLIDEYFDAMRDIEIDL